MRANGTLPTNVTLAVQLESVGILNGLVDDEIQDYWYPFFGYNNTYGIQAYSQADQLNALQAYTGPGGCLASPPGHVPCCRPAVMYVRGAAVGFLPSRSWRDRADEPPLLPPW